MKPPSVEETWSAAVDSQGIHPLGFLFASAHHPSWIFNRTRDLSYLYLPLSPADLSSLPPTETLRSPPAGSIYPPTRPRKDPSLLLRHALVMADSAMRPWSNNPYAPQIPYVLYLGEKAYFAGFLMGAIFYGTLTYVSAYPPLPRSSLPRPFDSSH